MDFVSTFFMHTLVYKYILKHSRCSIDSETFEMEIRAQSFIKKGQEITTRYFDPLVGQPGRQLVIEKSWKFICNCLRCHDPSELGTYFSAILCQSCTEKIEVDTDSKQDENGEMNDNNSERHGYLLPKDTHSLQKEWVCDKCGEEKSLRDIEHVLSSIKDIMDQIKAQILAIMNKKSVDLVRYLQRSVELLKEHLHPNHFLIFHYKIWVLELPVPEQDSSSEDISGPSVGFTIPNAQDHLQNQIKLFELQMKYFGEVLKILEILDPGLSLTRAEYYKRMGQCRIKLSQLKDFGDQNQSSKLNHMEQMDIAVSEFKQASLCFDYPERK